MNRVPLVRGDMTFEEGASSFTGATMYVRLVDITVADSASEVIS
jgi:hypothetical protein